MGKDKTSEKYSFEQRAVILDDIKLEFNINSAFEKNNTLHGNVEVSDE